MSGFFGKLFGGKKKESGAAAGGSGSTVGLLEEVMNGLLERAQLNLSYDIKTSMNGDTEEISIEMSGDDQDLLTEKEGALLDAFQLFGKRVLQHQLPEARVNVNFDCNGYREESSKALVELAERLKEKALEQGRSVYLRALPPKDRKIIHQHLANDERVRSRSVGDGLYKKIKIYPIKSQPRDNEGGGNQERDEELDNEVNGNF